MTAAEATTIPTFNPSKDPRVDAIKSKTEELIDLVRAHSESTANVDPRCSSLAITNYEQAAMWAVKALFVKG